MCVELKGRCTSVEVRVGGGHGESQEEKRRCMSCHVTSRRTVVRVVPSPLPARDFMPPHPLEPPQGQHAAEAPLAARARRGEPGELRARPIPVLRLWISEGLTQA